MIKIEGQQYLIRTKQFFSQLETQNSKLETFYNSEAEGILFYAFGLLVKFRNPFIDSKYS